MGEMIGMDTNQVWLLAGQLRTQGEGLSGIVASIDNLMHQFGTHWSGPAETEFLHEWQRTYRPGLVHVQTDVLGLAQSALNNVASQDQASGTAGSAIGQGIWGPNGGSSAQSQADVAAIRRETNGKSDSDVIAWWLNLSPAQRAEYLSNAPGALLALPGLGAFMSVYRSTTFRSVEQRGEVSIVADTWFGSVGEGANDQVIVVINEDGTATVEVGGGIYSEASKNVGADGSGLSLGLKSEAGVGRTYAFANSQDALNFYSQITKGGHPNALQLVKNIDQATRDPRLNLVSSTVSETVTASGAAQGGDSQIGGSANVGGSVQAIYDFKQHTETMNFTLSAAADGHVGLAGAQVNGDLQVSVVAGQPNDHQIGSVQTVTVSGKYETLSTVGSPQNNVFTGHGGTFSMQIDATNIDTMHQLDALRQDLQTGNTGAASAALNDLMKDSAIVTQSDTTAGAEVGQAPGGAVKVENTSTMTATNVTSTTIKAPGYSDSLPFP